MMASALAEKGNKSPGMGRGRRLFGEKLPEFFVLVSLSALPDAIQATGDARGHKAYL